MTERNRLLAHYEEFVETELGLEGRAANEGAALVFHDNEILYVLHNTASYDPGLISMTVCVPRDEEPEVTHEVCRAIADDVPCLRAWVDEDGDTVLNVQSIVCGAHLTPRTEQLREVVPRLIEILRYAVVRVIQDTTLVGISMASASCPLNGDENSQEGRGHRGG